MEPKLFCILLYFSYASDFNLIDSENCCIGKHNFPHDFAIGTNNPSTTPMTVGCHCPTINQCAPLYCP